MAKFALLLGVVGIFTLGSAAPTHAQAKGKGKGDAYSRVVQDGLLEFEAGNYAEARVMFEQAHALKPSARTLRGMGMASFELKEYVRSEKELNAALIDLRQPLSDAQRKEALALLLRLEHYIGKLSVRTDPPKVTVTLDGVAVVGREFKADLGRHELVAEAPGYRTLSRTITVEGGRTHVLDLKLTSIEAEASPPPAPGVSLTTLPPPAANETDSDNDGTIFETWWFWTALGVVAAGGVTAAVILTSKSQTEPPVAGNTGPAIQVLRWSH